MADEIIDYNEEELMTKLRAKRRFRGLLIAINFVLLGYLIYQIGSSIANLVKSAKKVEGIVAILDKSQKESLGIYDQYVKEDKVLDCDFAIYGEKIYFTKDVFNKRNLKPVDDVQILKMETDSDNTIFREALHYDNVEPSLNSGISLLYDKQNKPLEQGDYLFYSDYVSTQDFGNVLRVKNQLDMQYEIADESQVGVKIDQEAVPVQNHVKGVCGMLGLEPLYLACEGRMVVIVPAEQAQAILDTLHTLPYSQNAAIIGEVTQDHVGKVVMKTSIGSETLLPSPSGELLPRIC